MEKCRPLVKRKTTESRKVINEMTLNTFACRMKGMVRLMRKNSMLGRLRAMPGGVADGQALHLLAPAIDEVHEPARDHDRAEDRGEDPQAVDHREAAHRPRAERQ